MLQIIYSETYATPPGPKGKDEAELCVKAYLKLAYETV